MAADSFISAFLTLFLVIDPVGNVFIFMALTHGLSAAAKRGIALKGVLIAALVLGCFMLFGQWFLATIGIELYAFRIAGGLMLFVIGFEMLFEQRQKRKKQSASEAAVEQEEYSAIAVFPIAIPLLAGPGSMTAAILLGGDAGSDPIAMAYSFGVILSVLGITLILFLGSRYIEKGLGKSGGVVLTRIFGILLAALATQYVIDGIITAFSLGS